jgi:hypothetical protein
VLAALARYTETMAPQDPTAAIRKAASQLPGALEGTSCNQTSYKVGKQSFFFVGPGTKGVGYKAMFKLDESKAEPEQLASQQPGRFGVGKTAWVTARFSEAEPLPKKIWLRWLKESHGTCPQKKS